MAKPKSTHRTSALTEAELMLCHLTTLVYQADEQMGLLQMLVETRHSLESPPIVPPKKGAAGATPGDTRHAVLQQTLDNEIWRQIHVFSSTIDALCECTDKVTNPRG